MLTIEQITTEISLLMKQFQDPADDKRELLLNLQEKLNELRAFGMPVPADLLQFEQDLEQQVLQERQDSASAGTT